MGREPSAIAELFARPRRLAMLAAALTVPAVIIATQLYVAYRVQGARVSFGAVLVIQLCHWELWAVAGPLAWSLERRWPLVPSRRRQALLRHIAAAPLVATALLFLFWAVYHALVRLPLLSNWFAGFDRALVSTAVFFVIAYFHVELVLYGGIVAVAHAVRTTALLRAREHDALRLEAELTGARLTALRTQLQPHFLFNTLHTIGSLVLQRQNEQAVQILAELGELLRGTLAHRETDLAPLREEIAYLRRYLRIEEARFGDRLSVRWDIDPAAMDALIPPFILQPLVENAFRHGISRRADDSILSIAAAVEDQSLRITVYNDGPPLSEAFSLDAGSGYGLKNVSERLRTRNPAGRLELANAAAGVRATLILPRWDSGSVGSGR
jgi:two-component system, LytTR family, sensor kinase